MGKNLLEHRQGNRRAAAATRKPSNPITNQNQKRPLATAKTAGTLLTDHPRAKKLVKVKRATLSTKTEMAAMTMRRTKKKMRRMRRKKMKTTRKKTPPNQKPTMKSSTRALKCTQVVLTPLRTATIAPTSSTVESNASTMTRRPQWAGSNGTTRGWRSSGRCSRTDQRTTSREMRSTEL